MKRHPDISSITGSKDALLFASFLCFVAVATPNGFAQDKPNPISIEKNMKIHRLATTNRSVYDAFVYLNRIPDKVEDDETPEDLAGRILGRLANQEGRILVKLPAGMDRQAYLGYKTFLESEGLAKVGNCIACHAPPDFTDRKEHVGSQGGSTKPTSSLRNLAKRKVNLRQVIMAKMATSETKRAPSAEKIDAAYGKMHLNKGDLHQLMAFLNLLNDVPEKDFRKLILNAKILDTSQDIE
jgi:hypothetical protein|tara:strand:- start:1233 stop:1952 length:720 start_codon:yes stop_codon:yes gene_type:complete